MIVTLICEQALLYHVEIINVKEKIHKSLFSVTKCLNHSIVTYFIFSDHVYIICIWNSNVLAYVFMILSTQRKFKVSLCLPNILVDKVFKVCRYCLTTNCPFLISLDIKYCDYIFKILLLKWIALIHYYLIDALKNHAESVFSYISPLFKNIFSNSDFYLQYTERFFQLYICISKLWNIEKASNTFIITPRKTCLTFNAL